MYELYAAVCVSCELSEHCHDCLDATVVVLVYEVCADKRIEDDDANVVFFDLAADVGEQIVVCDQSVPAFCRERDLHGIFAIHEQPAFDVVWRDAVVLHGCDCAHLHLADWVF